MYVKRRAVTEGYKRVVQSVVCAEVPSFFVFCFFGSLCRKTRQRINKKRRMRAAVVYCLASRLVASCKTSMSTPLGGSCTYLTTDPLMKQLRTLVMCGYRSGSTTDTFVSLMFRYWSTLCSVPAMARSFFSSTTTCFPTKDLKYE